MDPVTGAPILVISPDAAPAPVAAAPKTPEREPTSDSDHTPPVETPSVPEPTPTLVAKEDAPVTRDEAPKLPTSLDEALAPNNPDHNPEADAQAKAEAKTGAQEAVKETVKKETPKKSNWVLILGATAAAAVAAFFAIKKIAK
jgi:hypothetical protein